MLKQFECDHLEAKCYTKLTIQNMTMNVKKQHLRMLKENN